MPRPKSDLEHVSLRLGDRDRAILDELARDPSTPTKTDVVREAIRRLHQSRRKKTEKSPR